MKQLDLMYADLIATKCAVSALMVCSPDKARLLAAFDSGVLTIESMLGPTPVSEEFLATLNQKLKALRDQAT